MTPPVPPDPWERLPALIFAPGAIGWYGSTIVEPVMKKWFWQATSDPQQPLAWVSQFQLYIDFMKCGEIGPLHVQGWQPGSRTAAVDILGFFLHVRTRWFAKVLRECLRHSSWKCSYHFCRPESVALMMHTGCLAVPWNGQRLTWIDDWIFGFFPEGVRRSTGALHSLPTADIDGRFPRIAC